MEDGGWYFRPQPPALAEGTPGMGGLQGPRVGEEGKGTVMRAQQRLSTAKPATCENPGGQTRAPGGGALPGWREPRSQGPQPAGRQVTQTAWGSYCPTTSHFHLAATHPSCWAGASPGWATSPLPALYPGEERHQGEGSGMGVGASGGGAEGHGFSHLPVFGGLMPRPRPGERWRGPFSCRRGSPAL